MSKNIKHCGYIFYHILLNEFIGEIIDAKIKEKALLDKSDICEFKDNSDLDKKIEILAPKAELKADQYKIVKLESFLTSSVKVILKMMAHKSV